MWFAQQRGSDILAVASPMDLKISFVSRKCIPMNIGWHKLSVTFVGSFLRRS